jgi:hypothetical protein
MPVTGSWGRGPLRHPYERAGVLYYFLMHSGGITFALQAGPGLNAEERMLEAGCLALLAALLALSAGLIRLCERV